LMTFRISACFIFSWPTIALNGNTVLCFHCMCPVPLLVGLSK
jgi:hypothetical protein